MNEPVPTSVTLDNLHRKLVDGLVTDLRPVRPLWSVRLRFLLWAALEIGILAGAVVIYGARHDLRQQLHSPLYVAELLGFMAAGVFAAALALRSAVPGIEPTRLHWLVLVTVTTAAVLTLAEHPAGADVSLSQFIQTGIGCVETTGFYAWLPWLALLLMVRRGAPIARGATGSLIGAGALMFTYGVMRVECPIDERYHLLMWHLLPGLIAIAISVFVGMVWLKSPSQRIK